MSVIQSQLKKGPNRDLHDDLAKTIRIDFEQHAKLNWESKLVQGGFNQLLFADCQMGMAKPSLEQLFDRVKNYRKNNGPGDFRLAFQNAEIIPKGTRFHYTHHPDKVRTFGRLKGVPLHSEFFRTQVESISSEATDPNGVVFFHDTLEKCCLNAWRPAKRLDPETMTFVPIHGLEILEVEFSAAVRAFHTGDGEINVMAIASDCVITRYTGKTGEEVWKEQAQDKNIGP